MRDKTINDNKADNAAKIKSSKEMEKEYVRCFYEEQTKTIHHTLKAAKLSAHSPRVYRCWMNDGEIKAMALVYHSDTHVNTIKSADKRISEAIKNKSVGKGCCDDRIVSVTFPITPNY